MNPAFLGWLKQTVQIAHQTGASSSGLPTYGTATSYAARVSPKDRWTIDKSGASVVSNADVIILADTTPIVGTDQITLPSGTKRPVLEIKSVYDQGGVLDHYEVLV